MATNRDLFYWSPFASGLPCLNSLKGSNSHCFTSCTPGVAYQIWVIKCQNRDLDSRNVGFSFGFNLKTDLLLPERMGQNSLNFYVKTKMVFPKSLKSRNLGSE